MNCVLEIKGVLKDIFTAIKIHVVFSWVVTPCRDVTGWQRFGGSCYFSLQGEDGGSNES